MYQAIHTRYFGAGNVRGSRVKATARAGSITLEWDDTLNSDTNHRRAAEALANKYAWRGHWYGGATRDGCVFVNTDGDDVPLFVTWGEEV